LKKGMFDPHLSFFELPIVRGTVIIVVALIVAAFITIIISSKPTWNLSYEGFNHFFTVFKFPLYGIGFLASLLALYATNHRSEQSKENMRLMRIQNNFSNYYKHLEEFGKHIDIVKKEFSDKKINDIEILCDIRISHQMLYLNALEGDYRIDDAVLFTFDEIINAFLVAAFKTSSDLSFLNGVTDTIRDFSSLQNKAQEVFHNISITTSPKNRLSSAGCVYLYIILIDKIIQFNRSYLKRSDFKEKLSNVKSEFDRLNRLNEYIFYVGGKEPVY